MGEKTEQSARILPLLPLRGVLVFPYMVINLDVGRKKSISALEEAMIQGRQIVLASQKDAQTDNPDKDAIYSVGSIAEIKQLLKLPGGTVRVLVEGLCRAKILEYVESDPFYKVKIEGYSDKVEKTPEVEALMRTAVYQFEQYVKLSKKVPPEAIGVIITMDEPGRLADSMVSYLALKMPEKQAILECIDIKQRLEKLSVTIAAELEILELERRISLRVHKQMEKTQKEYYLREQMKAIQKELGERDERGTETEEYREKIKEAKLLPEVEAKALKEVSRLEKMPAMMAESAVIRNYLDWLLAIPWNKHPADVIDIKKAEGILNEDHYALKKAKERILEYLAVCKLTEKTKGPIICFVGPPGVGKTSLGKSVARALGRKFVRMSLGGVKDEAEIRGHRRTYVGALPGRIIQGLKTAGTNNPVFLLDEVDKMSTDFRGDPSSALLEVLDPEQNNTFSDHFIEVPVDLSQVLFITTANVAYNIPRPLADRMELIHISGYTEEEKLQIAKNYLLPRQIKENGLVEEQIVIANEAIMHVIRHYTREAGVRNLERELAGICRKTAKVIAEGSKNKVSINVRNIEKYLGISRYHYGVSEKENLVGVVTGLAWTEVGGDVLSIEVTLMQGKGKLILTGKLGDVMKESAQTGYSFVRSIAHELGLEQDFHEKYDVHIHIPEGAIPKDGPSAGVTMATAVVSALTNRKVKSNVAMTGEITLRGRVLPVGGVKEKILAAHRAGSRVIIMPSENRKDLEDIPNKIKRDLEFIFVEHMDEVLKVALEDTNENIPS
ncbi:MAG: endopeptidase La [Clostridia bacterium]|nr:endopeptidase La [Clostridia bacterium]MDD4047585.1 endopeptidase La [Clostridia bacterium]